MEQHRTLVPMMIAAIIAIACAGMFFATDSGGPAQNAKGGITMITASVVGQAGATAVPTGLADQH